MEEPLLLCTVVDDTGIKWEEAGIEYDDNVVTNIYSYREEFDIKKYPNEIKKFVIIDKNNAKNYIRLIDIGEKIFEDIGITKYKNMRFKNKIINAINDIPTVSISKKLILTDIYGMVKKTITKPTEGNLKLYFDGESVLFPYYEIYTSKDSVTNITEYTKTNSETKQIRLWKGSDPLQIIYKYTTDNTKANINIGYNDCHEFYNGDNIIDKENVKLFFPNYIEFPTRDGYDMITIDNINDVKLIKISYSIDPNVADTNYFKLNCSYIVLKNSEYTGIYEMFFPKSYYTTTTANFFDTYKNIKFEFSVDFSTDSPTKKYSAKLYYNEKGIEQQQSKDITEYKDIASKLISLRGNTDINKVFNPADILTVNKFTQWYGTPSYDVVSGHTKRILNTVGFGVYQDSDITKYYDITERGTNTTSKNMTKPVKIENVFYSGESLKAIDNYINYFINENSKSKIDFTLDGGTYFKFGRDGIISQNSNDFSTIIKYLGNKTEIIVFVKFEAYSWSKNSGIKDGSLLYWQLYDRVFPYKRSINDASAPHIHYKYIYDWTITNEPNYKLGYCLIPCFATISKETDESNNTYYKIGSVKEDIPLTIYTNNKDDDFTKKGYINTDNVEKLIKPTVVRASL